MASLLDCAAISWAAYTGLAGINRELPDSCRDLLLGYEIRDVAEGVVMAKRGKSVVLAFRGTVSWRDIGSDLELWRREPFEAQLCALHVASALDIKDVRCVTFGSPGVGNAAFVSAFSSVVKESVRVAHVLDPIPKILPAAYFVQTPELQSVKGEATVSRVASSGFLSQLWGKLLQLVEGDMRYHRLATYIACLREESATERAPQDVKSDETEEEYHADSTGMPEGSPTDA
ncbi:hypothetical protein KFL_006650070 [Klebsormidium nitens]|uniref:Fungal lipase-type domain-containing protein n=1 Tax=Klebsormidium nitens TaxID=105231 RepID=A0A1Y1IIU8_KLENI|nr:hypothetical protein KFL_006650070 [Klebsormidium nitens]|eukprot:GAQ90633.1 hypothetical protein KFL_006650070 [Klebsormidium nitens]